MNTRYIVQRQGTFLSISTIADLADILSVSEAWLIMYACVPDYKSFKLPKKNGGYRLIDAPQGQLRVIQQYLNQYLQYIYEQSKSGTAYGFRKNYKTGTETYNIISHASLHIGRKYLLNIDLEDFFHSISSVQVRNIFLGEPFSFNYNLASLLAALTTFYDRLPMGTPTSPVLSNFACMDLDVRLDQFAMLRKWKYTRYADDLTFSSDSCISESDTDKIRSIIEGFEFRINEKKIRMRSSSQRQTVTGLTVNEKVNLPRHYYRKLRAILYDCKTNGPDVAAQRYLNLKFSPTQDQVQLFLLSLNGKIQYFTSVRGQEDLLVKKVRRMYCEAMDQLR